MLRLARYQDPLIGRPLALYDTVTDGGSTPELLDVMYLVKGKFTQALATYRPGDVLEVWGPLGNGFRPAEAPNLILVAGGIGQTPFLTVTREALGTGRYGQPARPGGKAKRVVFCYGARTAAALAGVDDFEQAGAEVRVATDDGTAGTRGLVTHVLRSVLQEVASPRQILCCGPEPMMAAVAALAAEFQTPCQVSLETPMACGIGICFTCVAKIRDEDGEWDYRRTCVEGPVFDAQRVVWD